MTSCISNQPVADCINIVYMIHTRASKNPVTWTGRVSTASVRKHGNRTENVRCKHVISTYNFLTTYATYDTRNRSSLAVACGPRTHTVSMTCVLSTPVTSYACIIQNTYGQRRGRAGVTVALRHAVFISTLLMPSLINVMLCLLKYASRQTYISVSETMA